MEKHWNQRLLKRTKMREQTSSQTLWVVSGSLIRKNDANFAKRRQSDCLSSMHYISWPFRFRYYICRLTSQNVGTKEDNCLDCDDLVQKSRRKSNVTKSDLPPDSAKTRKIMELLAEIGERSGGIEKTIIFSQFTSMLDLIEPFLRAEEIQYVRCKLQNSLRLSLGHSLLLYRWREYEQGQARGCTRKDQKKSKYTCYPHFLQGWQHWYVCNQHPWPLLILIP